MQHFSSADSWQSALEIVASHLTGHAVGTVVGVEIVTSLKEATIANIPIEGKKHF